MTQPKESHIQKTILDYLTVHRVFAYRNNTGAVAADYKGKKQFVPEKKRFIRFGVKGGPDIVAVIKGQFIGIEVKRPGQVQTAAQAAFETSLTLAGGKYILAHSFKDVEYALEGLIQ
jgi:hypothetical protein